MGVGRLAYTMAEDKLVFETSADVEIVPTFDEIGLREDLLRGIYAYGFEKPSAVQQRAIGPIIAGRDVIAQSQSGTGKTSLIGISALQTLDTKLRSCQVLVLSPTRELAAQIEKNVKAIGDYMSVVSHACYGGKSIGEDIRKLDNGVHIVSGTPGRVFDMIKRRNLRTRSIKMFVLDEADEMLSQGFKEQIYDVYRYLPPATQVVLISATLPHEVLEMTTKFMTDPVRILVKRDELTLEGIKQFSCSRKRRVEIRHLVRPVRYPYHHASCDFLQHKAKSGMAHQQNARGQFHGGLHARRYAPKGV